MIYRAEVLLRRARRWISRSEWLARLLGLPVSADLPAAPGLVMIQIDGLARRQLDRALAKGEMPFLGKLLRQEHYRLHDHYSGLPSSTPAVQGELFYGVKGAVPAFSFLDHEAGQVVRMFDPDAASRVEAKLRDQGEPLLAGGAAYCDIYTGGAAESHFCPSSFGWDEVWRAANPFALAILVISNIVSVLRVAVLLVVEAVLAVIDMVHGLIEGRDLAHELKFVPSRVAICILLRELCTIGAEIDVARGLPVIHLNFLGYDEQAHRRGPSSKFAHWSLKGIDHCIARIWRAAQRSARREYDVWIYSDHGQEETRVYSRENGRTIEAAVNAVLTHLNGGRVGGRESHGVQSQRARFLGGRRTQSLLPVYAEGAAPRDPARITVAAMGPVGHVYLSDRLSVAEQAGAARALVAQANVPLVLTAAPPDDATAWTAAGRFALASDGDKVLGPAHPFLAETTRDLIALCNHPDAGDLVLCGWAHGAAPHSFPVENGSHAGAGPEETRAFALLPDDTPLEDKDCDYLRPIDLRHAAFKVLRRAEHPVPAVVSSARAGHRRLRIMTYNVHGCIGMDGKMSPERIARVIARHAPDVVALQELDVGRPRSGGIDQAETIARLLRMQFHFQSVLHLEEEQYGNAVLTHLPLRLVKADGLPAPTRGPRGERRGALWVAVELDGVEIQIINTHLGLRPDERRAQAKALVGDTWLGHPDCRAPVILCGDLNALPKSFTCRTLGTRLRDSQASGTDAPAQKTFFGRYPAARIDHVFVDPAIEVIESAVPNTQLTRVASDHLPLVADLRIPGPTQSQDAGEGAAERGSGVSGRRQTMEQNA